MARRLRTRPPVRKRTPDIHKQFFRPHGLLCIQGTCLVPDRLKDLRTCHSSRWYFQASSCWSWPIIGYSLESPTETPSCCLPVTSSTRGGIIGFWHLFWSPVLSTISAACDFLQRKVLLEGSCSCRPACSAIWRYWVSSNISISSLKAWRTSYS